MVHRLKNLFKYFFGILLIVLASAWILLHFSPVQTWLVQKASRELSQRLNAEISIKKVDFSIFKKIILEGILIRDQKKDTLLYSGRISASFNNWFILKDNTVFHDIRLEYTSAYLNRKDSIWNYQFLADAFQSPKSNKETKLPNIRFDHVLINQLQIKQQDEWVGEDMNLSVGRLEMTSDQFLLSRKIINIKELDINFPEYIIVYYKGKRPAKLKSEKKISETSVIQPILPGWTFNIKRIRISNGKFEDYKKNYMPLPYFDSEYISFKEINGNLDSVKISGDSITCNARLKTKERSGLEIRNLNARLNFHSRGMEFKDLMIETPFSKITDQFSMKYQNFSDDFMNFNDRVRLEAVFNNSILSTKDIAYFAPTLKKINETVKINGEVKGVINQLKGNNLFLEAGKHTRFSGNLSLQHVTDLKKLRYDIDARYIQTTAKELSKYIPEINNIKSPARELLGIVQYKGKASGTLNVIDLNGSTSSDAGNITTKITLQIPEKGIPSYKGLISTSDFHLGKIFNNKRLGKLNTQILVDGKGFNTKDLNLVLNQKIMSVEFMGYKYENIEFTGIANNRFYDGHIRINDPYISVNLDAKIAQTINDSLDIKIRGDISRMCFNELNLLKRDLLFKGNIQSDFRIKNIDDFTGFILMNNLSLMENGKLLPLNNFSAKNTIDLNGFKNLEIHSDFIDASVNGIFSFSKMNNVLQKLLSTYFPTYFKSNFSLNEYQIFDFSISTHEIEPFLSFFDLPFIGGNNSVFSGNINTDENIYVLNADIPHININNTDISNLTIKSNNNIAKLNVHGEIGMLSIGEGIKISNTAFDVLAANDTGSVSINTNFSESIKNTNLKSRFEITQDGIGLVFEKSGFVLNEKLWNIENDSKIFLGKKNLFSEGITLSSGNEEIKFFTHPSDLGAHNDITIEIRKLELGELIPLAFKDPRIEGTSTGRIDILDPLGNLEVEGKISTENLRINNDSIGLVPIETKYSHKKKLISYNINSDNLNHIFRVKGSTNFFNPDSIYTDNIADITEENLKIIEPYLTGILADLKGTGTGILRISGYTDNLQLTGNIRLNNASLMIDYTKCRYQILPGARIEFGRNSIDFGNMLLRDSVGRVASFSGRINHSFFSDIAFDLHFETMNKNKGLLVLNTTAKDNATFYGKVVAYANGEITGSGNNISIKLKGQPTDSSRIYLPTSDSRVTGTASFIVFRQYGEDMKISTKIQESSSLLVDLDLIANPLAKVYLILDEVTNDIIEGQGRGAINLRINTSDKTTITGNFEITKGKYNFNWQSLFKKPFLIDKGTINWTGDPYDARINIDANYVVEQVKLPNEIANGCTNDRNNILVVANLSNTLKSPIIKFRFELPQGHPCRNNPLTTNSLAQLYNNPDELNRQVISLLLIGSFISSGANQSTAGSGLGNTFFSSAAGTLSEFIAQQVTTGLDAVLRNVPGLKDLRLDPYVTFTPGLITSTQAEGIGFQGTGSFGFTRRLLNGRMLVRAGGSVLVAAGQSAAAQNNRQLTPDLSLEWLITPDGKLRLIGFYRTVFDIQRRNDRTGVSFSYIKEFDKIWGN